MKKIIVLFSVSSVSIAIGLILMFHHGDLRCLWVSHSKQFRRIVVENTPIFVSIDTPEETLKTLVYVFKRSKNEVEKFWAGFSNEATIIYCHNERVYSKYGVKGVPALTRLGSHVILPSDGIYVETISHELCHTELFARLGKNWWVYYQKLPCWFDEGLALQFNNTGTYEKNALDTVPRWPINKLRTIDRPRKFYRNDSKITLHHYLVAKKEIALWLSEHSKNDLLNVIDSLRKEGEFYAVYQNIK